MKGLNSFKKIILLLACVLFVTAGFSLGCGKPDPKKYTVSFNTSGGEEIVSQVVEENKTAVKPQNPKKQGTDVYEYEFIKWLFNGEEYDFSTPVTSDITLVAEYRQYKFYTINFNVNGGTAVNSIRVEENTTFSCPLSPKKQNAIILGQEYEYEFTKWTLNGEQYDFSIPVTQNITLVAEYNEYKVYTITFNSNGGVHQIPSVKVREGEKVKDPKIAGYMVGETLYISDGWEYLGDTWDFEGMGVYSNMELTARWKEDENGWTGSPV